MKKRILILGAAVAVLFSGAVAANCSSSGYATQLTGTSVSSALTNKRIDANAPGAGGENWNEDHCASGQLYKVGLGVGDPVDPYALRGSWSVSGNNVSYTYGTLAPYVWTLWTNGSGGLCWENAGSVVATMPSAPGTAGPCSAP